MSSSNRSHRPLSDRPSLKQRAAELEAGLARVARRPGTTEAADPAFEVTADYQAAWDALGAAIDAGGGQEVPEAEDACSAAYARLRAVRPTTPAGFQALAETWAWRLRAEGAMIEDGEPGSLASHAAASLIAGAGVYVPLATDAPASPELADLIMRHRNLVSQADADGLSDEAADTLFDKAWSLFRQACSFPITGTADLAAKLDLVAAEITEGVERGRTITAAHAWRCLHADLLRSGALSRLASVGWHPDAALLALGTEFMAAWMAEEADGDEPEYRACSRIAERIVRTPAATVAGYGIKALLLARLDSDTSGPHAPIAPSGPVDSWWNVLRQVQQGAARLARLNIAPLVTDAEHDLTGLPLMQLARLYETMEPFEDLIGRSENAPCFWLDDSVRTAAGDILCREAARLDRLLRAIAEEIKRRRPADDDERDERLNVLVRRAALLDGLTTDRALLAEVLAASDS